MTRPDFLKLIDELLDKEPGTVQGGEPLAENGWDSLAVISFIALMDEHFSVAVSPVELAKCARVEDLVSLMGTHLQAV